ncbi:unnamed protein product [Brassica oleracea var. botrytis]
MLSVLCRPLSASVSWNPVRSFVLAFNSVSPIFQDLKVCDNRCLAVAELALPEDKGDSVLCWGIHWPRRLKQSCFDTDLHEGCCCCNS